MNKKLLIIKFYDSPSVISDERNIKIVHNSVKAFNNQLYSIDSKDILVYFASISSHPSLWFGQLGTMKVKYSPDHDRFFELLSQKTNIEISAQNLRRYQHVKYFIFLSSDIRDSDSNISKVHTIAHELQHIVQDINNELNRKRASVLIQYFYLKGNWVNEIYRKLPIEFDAFLVSKKTNYSLYGKKEVDNFLADIIKKSKPRDKSYWEFVDSIEVNDEYDLNTEMETLWEEHINSIEKLYYKAFNSNDPKYKEFLDSYNHLKIDHYSKKT